MLIFTPNSSNTSAAPHLLDRTNNPINVNDLNKINTDKELSELIQIISSLPKEKRQLVIAYVKGILNS